MLVWKASRLTRSLRDLTAMIDIFHHNNVALISFSERFDLTTAMGKAMLQVAGVFAELERNNLSENVRLGQKRKAREGGWNGGTIFGYDCTPDGLKINEQEAATVRRIYEWYTNGKGALTICNLLNAEMVPTKQGGKWYVQGVLTILDNPVYKGYIRYGVMNEWAEKGRKGKQDDPILVKGLHEPNIAEEMWLRVQAERSNRAAQPVRHIGHYLLTGLLRCPTCGAKMVGWHTSRSGRLFRYYKCGAFNSQGKAVCRGNYVNADKAEHEVLSRLSRTLPYQEFIAELVSGINAEMLNNTEPLQVEHADVERQIATIRQKSRRLLEALEDGTLPKEMIRARMEELTQAQSVLIAWQESLEQELQRAADGGVSTSLVWEALSRFHETISAADYELQKRLLTALIDRITVTKERVVDQVLLAFDPLSLLCTLEAEPFTASSVTSTYDTVHLG